MRPSSGQLLVLQGLRLKGLVAADELAAVVSLPSELVAGLLSEAGQDGYARYRDGARRGWTLTPEGRKEGERLLADELDDAGLRGQVTELYRRFLVLNPRLLQTCTRWQIADVDAQVLNDHQDQAYDASVLAELSEIHRDALPICAELGSLFDRFGSYRSRLSAAEARVRSGDTDWFTRPTINSYHTVWFELHEDLLSTLGIDRGSEPDGSTASTDSSGQPCTERDT